LKKQNTVGFWEKTALGVGWLPGLMGWQLVKTLSVAVYQMILGVNPVLLGIAMAIPTVWDAVTDPVMGNISDNFHSRWGRRRPFIVLGAVLMGIAFGLIWMVPPGWSDISKVVYLTVTSVIYATCYTVYMVPLQSLQLEMTPDYDERTRVAAYSSFFMKISDFTYQWIFPLSQLAIFSTVLIGVRFVGWGVGIFIFMGLGVIPGIFVKERYYKKAVKQEKVKFGAAVAAVFSNRGFMILVSLTILLVISGMFASSLDYYLLVYYVHNGDIMQGSVWKGILSSVFAVVGLISIWPTMWMSQKFGKRTALAVIYGMVVIGGVMKWFIFKPGHTWMVCWDALLCGPIWTAVGILQPAMLADVCDDDELKFGKRREGMFGALFSWVQKCGIALSFLGTGVALQLAGFDSTLGGAQSESTFTIMRLMLVVIPAATSLLAVIALIFYPISRQRAAGIRGELESRRGKI
jgi:GPH family glycoside/pentoside/hexuronide:cation symporter